MDPAQWLDNGVAATRVPGTADRADIAGGATVNFNTVAFPNPTATLTTLYLGGNNDGPTGSNEITGNSATTGTGLLNVSGGTMTVSTWTILGQQAGIANMGTFNLTGGTFHQAGTDVMAVGQAGYGLFTIQSGATATIDNKMTIGRNAGSFGTVTISGATSFLSVDPSFAGNPFLMVGESGNGTLNIFGGTVSAGTDVGVGQNNGAVGVVNQTAGTLNIGMAAHHKWLFIGNGGGSTGTYNISGAARSTPAKTSTSPRPAAVSERSTSPTALRSTCRDTSTSAPAAAVRPTSPAATSPSVATCGAANGTGIGVINQGPGANVTVGGWTYIADNTGSTGTFNMTGGTFTQPGGRFYVSRNGNGTVIQSGGTLNAPDFNVAGDNAAGAVGLYQSSGNAVLNVSGQLDISSGNNGFGTVTLGGNSRTTAQRLNIGADGLNGVLNIQDNAVLIDVANGADFNIGQNAGHTGVVNQSGGVFTDQHSPSGWMNISRDGGVGSYNLSGTGVVNVTGMDLNVGFAGGTGTFSQSNTTTVNAGTVAWVGVPPPAPTIRTAARSTPPTSASPTRRTPAPRVSRRARTT